MATKTPIARLSYARLHVPETKDGRDKYSAMLIFEPGTDMKELEKAAWAAALEHYGTKEKMPVGVRKRKLEKGSGWPFRDGEDQDGKSGHEDGGMYINVSTYGDAPKVVRKLKGVLHAVAANEIKSGDYVKVMVTAKGFRVDGNSGVTFYMGNVLFVKPGEALGGGATDPNADFEDDDDAEAADISDDDDGGFDEDEAEKPTAKAKKAEAADDADDDDLLD